MKKTLLVVLDGIGDRPVSALGNKTPLEAAKTPNLDRMVEEGSCGLLQPVYSGSFPTSHEAHLSLFGYDLTKWNLGRGVFEAIGIGAKLKEGDVAWRGNWATIDDTAKIIDRRAGRILKTKKLIQALSGIKIKGIEFILIPGIAHRLAIIMRGPGISSCVGDNDLHQTGIRPSIIVPLDNQEESKFTALILNEFLERTHKILKQLPFNKQRKKNNLFPANYLLLRGAGELKSMPKFNPQHPGESFFISGGYLYRGIALSIGMKKIKVKGATGRFDTNLVGKFAKAVQILQGKECSFLFLHVKATDTFSHDGKCFAKMKFIERIDEQIKQLFALSNATVIITADHCTPCELKEHSADLIPFLVWGKEESKDSIAHFGERNCQDGQWGIVRQNQLLNKIMR
jgi:2,3-bisphosphoglycerate-independent phosphoglycerate mutase